MAVFRIEKTKNYTVMSNVHLKDKNLSLKAKGLLSVMLSLPDEWDYSVGGLVAISKENETSINSTIKELKQRGYLVVNKLLPNQTKSGRIEYEYIVYEQPIEIQDTEKQAVDEQDLENLGVEHQEVENMGLYKYTNKSNTKRLNTKESNKDKKVINDEFEELWKQYPNKKGKADALKHYIKARTRKDNPATFDIVMDGILRYRRYIEDTDQPMQYVKHGSTFFHQECWDDDYSVYLQTRSFKNNRELSREEQGFAF